MLKIRVKSPNFSGITCSQCLVSISIVVFCLHRAPCIWHKKHLHMPDGKRNEMPMSEWNKVCCGIFWILLMLDRNLKPCEKINKIINFVAQIFKTECWTRWLVRHRMKFASIQLLRKIALQHAFKMLFYASDCKSKIWLTFDKSYYSLNPV